MLGYHPLIQAVLLGLYMYRPHVDCQQGVEKKGSCAMLTPAVHKNADREWNVAW